MRKARVLLILGVWIAVLPYLGFPIFWKNILITLSGAGLAYFSYLLYREWKEKQVPEKTFDNFSENLGYGEVEEIIEERIELEN